MRLRTQKVALVVINQIREKVGVVYGSPETNAGGGRSLEYYLGVDLRCSVKKSDGDLLKDADNNLEGIKGTVKNTKNKLTIPFQKCEFRLFFDEGLDPWYGLPKMLETGGLVTRNGAWYTCGDQKFQAKTLKDKVLDAEKGSPFYEIKEKLGLT